jgi:hypothetical protein
MRTTLDLPDPTFRKLKAEASLRGLKLKEILCQLIEAGLAAGKEMPSLPPSRRSKLPIVRKATGKPHPAISNARLDEILAMEEGNVGH